MRLTTCARMWSDPIYCVDFVFVCSTVEQFQPKLRQLLGRAEPGVNVDGILGRTSQRLDDFEGRVWPLPLEMHGMKARPLVVIWLRKDAAFSSLVHELWHAAFWVFTSVGCVFDEGIDEPMAYYLTWLTGCALEGVK